MGIREISGALGRRWYVLIVGVILTLGGAWFVYTASPPDYTARGLVLLLPPAATGEAVGANPFLQLGGLDLTARVLVATYSSTAFADELKSVSPDAEAQLSVDDTTRGGVVAIDVKDHGEKRALDTLAYVTDTVSQRLANLQKDVGVKPADTVRSMELAMDTEAEPDYQTLIRLLVLEIGGGLAAAIIIALAVDSVVERRRHRSAAVSPRDRGRHRGDAATAEGPIELSEEESGFPVDDTADVEDGDSAQERSMVSAHQGGATAARHDSSS
ncbi:hypothetical protein GH740_02430 [Microbacterium sp. SYP-A9085]|uniref:hypothetical protein n=1 Tax=Microbacterium sp. SYP-A9085 TaxID=2664454 RepID=UPI00129BC37F|nr:hypothetical protein [Microbacterium sp. SYP-A9085]MRH28169.1 hypothetical protein [Microbacterium sp. SYP-A9085]